MELLTSAPKGLKDVTPDEIYKWHYIEGVAKQLAFDFGFTETRVPTFEHTELFLRGVGDTTDVVQKEMYTFNDKGGRSVTLRPEGTASVVRSYLENSIYAAGLPAKLFYIVPNFRYENTQKGRLREHHQFGVECFGAAGAEADSEIIALAAEYLRRLGIKNVELEINSIGCPSCRAEFHKALKAFFSDRRDKLCATCNERLEKNPMRILDCKSEVCKELSKDAPVVLDYLCGDCREHFEKVKAYLDAMGIAYRVNPRIVRGLDYYTRTVFEFISTVIGAQSTVIGGGRYDALVSTLGGDETPALGFGSGIERMLLVMEAEGIEIPREAPSDIFIACQSGEADMKVQVLVNDLRRLGVSAVRDITGRSLKAQMKYAGKLKVKYSMVLGESELASGKAMLKNMETGEQTECPVSASAVAEAIK